VWLDRGAQRLSTLDLFGRNFTLLGGPAAQEWARCAHAAAGESRIGLEAFCVGTDGLDDHGSVPAAYGIEPSGCALVRPDGFVGWRSENGEPASSRTLSAALAQMTGGSA
jgi:hypothetical protein